MTVELTAADTATTSPTTPQLAEPTQALPMVTLVVMAAACGSAAANIYYNQPLLSDFAASQIGYGLGVLFFVPLGDLLERRRVLLTLAFTCTVLLVGTAMVPTLALLVVAQLLVGITAMSSQLLIPLAVDLSPTAQRGRVVGILMAGLLAGLLLARTLGGFVGDHFGWRAMYWLAAGVMLLNCVVLRVMLPRRPPTQKLSYAQLMRSLADLFRSQPVLRTASFISATSFGSFCAFWAVLSFLMRDRFGRGATEAGMFGIVGLAGALFAPMAGKLSDRRGPAFTLTIAMLISIVAFAQMWGWCTIAGLVVGVLLLDLGVQSTQVAAQSEVMALVPDARSRLNTIYMVARFIGGAIGSALGTAAYARAGWGGTCAVSILMLVLGTAAHLIRVRRNVAKLTA
jgi:predicted MFS family arabinose efflux permease